MYRGLLPVSRRTVLGVGAAGAVVAAGSTIALWPGGSTSGPPVLPDSEAVLAAERARTATGGVVKRTLTAAPTSLDLGGRVVDTWAFGSSLPGATIRATAGDRLSVTLINSLPAPTSLHWHGLALRNDMDGVPGLTQTAVPSAQTYRYDFVLPDPGTYWFHPHYGVQLDTGLYAPLIVEDPNEEGSYDEEVVIVLDDWTDGWSATPDAILANFKAEGMAGMDGMDGMDMSGDVSAQEPLGSDTGDVTYPAHLINGLLPAAPHVIRSRPGRRLRLRVINAASDTAYRFAIGGHGLTVTHTDGFPTQAVDVDTLIIGMGERYDLIVELRDGTFPVVAQPEGKDDPPALAVLTSSEGAVRFTEERPSVSELSGRLLSYDDLVAASSAELAPRAVDRELEMTLTMGKGGREWLINGRTYADREPLDVVQGERVRLTMTNNSPMFHPMHLHGHTYALSRPDGRGPRKDTVNVLPMATTVVEFDANNPGQWLAHCHNIYHGELGMMTSVSYVGP